MGDDADVPADESARASLVGAIYNAIDTANDSGTIDPTSGLRNYPVYVFGCENDSIVALEYQSIQREVF